MNEKEYECVAAKMSLLGLKIHESMVLSLEHCSFSSKKTHLKLSEADRLHSQVDDELWDIYYDYNRKIKL